VFGLPSVFFTEGLNNEADEKNKSKRGALLEKNEMAGYLVNVYFINSGINLA